MIGMRSGWDLAFVLWKANFSEEPELEMSGRAGPFR